jgi:Major Facilitator Superfamily
VRDHPDGGASRLDRPAPDDGLLYWRADALRHIWLGRAARRAGDGRTADVARKPHQGAHDAWFSLRAWHDPRPAAAPWLVGLPFVGFAGPAFVFAGGGAVVLWFAFMNLRDDGPDDIGRGAVNSYPSIGGAPAGASITAATADQNSERLALTDKRIWPWMLMGLVMGHAQAMTGQAIGFLVIDRLGLPLGEAQQAIGIVLMVGAGAALLVQWGLIPLLNLAPRNMVIFGLVIAATGTGLTGVAESLYGIACAYALACVGFGFTRPGFTAGSSLAVDRRLQGAVAGRVTSVNGAAFILGPSIGVGLYELYQPLPYFLSAVMLAGLIIYALFKLKPAPLDTVTESD